MAPPASISAAFLDDEEDRPTEIGPAAPKATAPAKGSAAAALQSLASGLTGGNAKGTSAAKDTQAAASTEDKDEQVVCVWSRACT